MSSRNVPVRAASADDIPAIQDVVRRSYLALVARIAYPWAAVQHWVSNDVGAAAVTTLYKTSLVAVIEGEIVGWLAVDGTKIVEFWVDPRFQHNAVGSTLLLTAESQFIDNDANLRPTIEVFIDNTAAFSFLDRVGWVPSGAPVSRNVAPNVDLEYIPFSPKKQ